MIVFGLWGCINPIHGTNWDTERAMWALLSIKIPLPTGLTYIAAVIFCFVFGAPNAYFWRRLICPIPSVAR